MILGIQPLCMLREAIWKSQSDMCHLTHSTLRASIGPFLRRWLRSVGPVTSKQAIHQAIPWSTRQKLRRATRDTLRKVTHASPVFGDAGGRFCRIEMRAVDLQPVSSLMMQMSRSCGSEGGDYE